MSVATDASAVIRARSRLGNLTKKGDAGAIADARRNLAAAKLEAYVAGVVADAPPLTPEQADRIAALLRGGGAA